MNLTAIATAIGYLVAAIAGYGFAWSARTHTIDKMILEQKDERINQQRSARATLERNMQTQQAAADAATRRSADLRRDADLARGELGRMRNSTKTIVRSVADSPATCPAVVAASAEILAESSSFIQEVARDADQCFSDIKLMQESWPK